MKETGGKTQSRWEIDSLQLRGRKVFITGWLLAPELKLNGLQLRLIAADGQSISALPLTYGLNRPDVKQAHPQENGAELSGFVGMGAWPRAVKPGDQLQLEGMEGERLILRLPLERPTATIPSGRTAVVAQWFRYTRRAIRLLAVGQWRSLIEKVHRQLRDRPQFQAGEALPQKWHEQLKQVSTPGIHLIVDHRLGGGANQYRQELVQQRLERGGCTLVLTYHLAALQPMLQLISPNGEERLGLADWNQLVGLLQDQRVCCITYNTAVSLADPETLAAVMLRLHREHACELRVLLHDFYLLCPSHFLLDKNGKFCGIPNQSRCSHCLPSNRYGFTSLFDGDVQRWRQIWGPLLQSADRIIAFSNDSVEHLRQAYQDWPNGQNWLIDRTVEVLPHQLDPQQRKSVTPRQTDRMVIGIVGQIGHHKGAALVQRLAETILEAGSEERICVIGSIEGPVDRQIVQQTGPYRREQLADWIEQSGANIMLLPSIWPETFSYVAEELMALQLPLACFNLGAPAERVQLYSRGIVIDSQEPQTILKELRQLLRTCYPSTIHNGI